MVRGIRYQNILEARTSPPYEKVPQLQFTNNKVDLHGFDVTTLVDLTQFANPRPNAVEGTRLVLNPQVSYPMQSGGWFLTPKVGLHATHYSLNRYSESGRSMSRVLPTFSIDSGLVLERDSRWLGEDSVQTLEPRLFYVRTPYRNQGDIPVFDSVATDLSFAQLFSENSFTGHDRIADADHLTAALVSRQIEQATGIERLRLAVAQRFYFSSQDVTIPGQPVRVDRRSDLLFAASGDFRGGHSLNAGVQYAIRDKRVPRLNLSYRYRPGGRKLFNAGVRYQSKEYAQWDTSLAWPIAANWTALGRINYSFLKKDLTTGRLVDVKPGLVEGLLGVEYARDCWAVRVVAHRFVTTTRHPQNVHGRLCPVRSARAWSLRPGSLWYIDAQHSWLQPARQQPGAGSTLLRLRVNDHHAKRRCRATGPDRHFRQKPHRPVAGLCHGLPAAGRPGAARPAPARHRRALPVFLVLSFRSGRSRPAPQWRHITTGCRQAGNRVA